MALMKICHTCQGTYADDHQFCPRDGTRLAHQVAEPVAQFPAGLSGRFRFVRALGAGGLGTVFLAEQFAGWRRLRLFEVCDLPENRRVLPMLKPPAWPRPQRSIRRRGGGIHPNRVGTPPWRDKLAATTSGWTLRQPSSPGSRSPTVVGSSFSLYDRVNLRGEVYEEPDERNAGSGRGVQIAALPAMHFAGEAPVGNSESDYSLRRKTAELG